MMPAASNSSPRHPTPSTLFPHGGTHPVSETSSSRKTKIADKVQTNVLYHSVSSFRFRFMSALVSYRQLQAVTVTTKRGVKILDAEKRSRFFVRSQENGQASREAPSLDSRWGSRGIERPRSRQDPPTQTACFRWMRRETGGGKSCHGDRDAARTRALLLCVKPEHVFVRRRCGQPASEDADPAENNDFELHCPRLVSALPE
jgi:hypothetical protein